MKNIFRIFFFVLAVSAINAAPIFEVGLSTGRHVPVALVGAFRLDAFVFQVEGMGIKQETNDFWMTYRGTLAYRFFDALPFSLDAGVSCGHLYAKAPNKRNQAFNQANNTHSLWNFNHKEYIDISLALSANLFGFKLTTLYPVFKPINSSSTNLLWNIAYIVEL